MVDEELFSIETEKLKDLFPPYPDLDDPHYLHQYDVTEKNIERIQTYIKHRIDLDKYDYEMSTVVAD